MIKKDPMRRFDVETTNIDGMLKLKASPFKDDRGSFQRLFCSKLFVELGWPNGPLQTNLSHSKAEGTIRGMHFQAPPYAEMKLLFCVTGGIFDAVVDLRANSPTFLSTQYVELNSEDNTLLLIPSYCAHGFQTLQRDTKVIYFHSAEHNPTAERVLSAFDPTFSIPWPIDVTVISEKDRQAELLPKIYRGLPS